MNNNFYTIPESWYKQFDNTFDISNKMKNNLDPKEGFLRGNLFDNLYKPYKNYTYGNLKATNKKEEMLYNLLMYKFALIELNLHLDIYPNDMIMVNLFKKYQEEENKLCKEFEKNYEQSWRDFQNA
jgi:hypothetical protein